MRKKLLGISFIILVLLLVSFGAPSPGFMPDDPDQPIRPLLLEDQTLKEDYLSIIQDHDLNAIARSDRMEALAHSYAELASQTAHIHSQGVEHPLLSPLESYFRDLSTSLSTMAIAFENTDPDLLKSANRSLEALDLEFQKLQQ